MPGGPVPPLVVERVVGAADENVDPASVSGTGRGGRCLRRVVALLLRDIPRTATVIATTRSRLYALERDDFLAAVTGHSAVRAAGDAVVEERLQAR